MGLIDKIKNTFFYEEEDDEVKKEVIKVEIPAPKKEEINEELKENKKDDKVFFDEDDFININKSLKQEEILEKKEIKPEIKREYKDYSNPYKGEYKDNYKIIEQQKKLEEKKFKPTPVISPVYGVLDKNYKKEDIVHKNIEKVYKDSEGMTIDDLRNKAFGTLEDELENTMCGKDGITLKEVKLEVTNDNLLDDLELEMKQTKDAIDLLNKDYDLFDDTTSENYEPQHIDNLEEKKDLSDDDLFNLIDSLYESEDRK